MSEKQGRGQLTERVQEKAKELLGEEITLRQLRLMPYLIDCSMNSQKVDMRKVTGEEVAIYNDWCVQGYFDLEGRMTKKFWNITTEIVYLAYVDLS